MRKSTTETIIRRLAAAFERREGTWNDESRAEFARQISDLIDEDALVALDYVERHEEYRPTIAKFRAETVRAGRDREARQPPKRRDPSPTERDREATRFFAPRLKSILAGIGNGPQSGAAAACDALVEEWHQRTGDPDERF